eukprot:c54314_g1_i1 orf=246-650(-)
MLQLRRKVQDKQQLRHANCHHEGKKSFQKENRPFSAPIPCPRPGKASVGFAKATSTFNLCAIEICSLLLESVRTPIEMGYGPPGMQPAGSAPILVPLYSPIQKRFSSLPIPFAPPIYTFCTLNSRFLTKHTNID